MEIISQDHCLGVYTDLATIPSSLEKELVSYSANFNQNYEIILFIAWKFSEGHGLLVFLGNSNIFMLTKPRVTRVPFLN